VADNPVIWLARRVCWLLLVFLSLLTGADIDLWGHVRFGMDFLRDWKLPVDDPYSYTQDVPWINHEWMAEALMGAAYQWGGTAGLVGLKAGFVLLSYAMIVRAYRHAAPLAGEAIAIVTALASLSLTMSVRPQIWSFAGIAVLGYLISARSERLMFVTPFLLIAWVNLHGGWIIGLAIVGLWCMGETWRQRRIMPAIAFIGAGSLLGTLVNPYGWHIWDFVLSTVRLSRDRIVEWGPIWSDSWQTIASWLTAATLLAGIGWRILKDRDRLDLLVILGGFGFAAQRVQRLVPLFFICTVQLLAPAISEVLKPRSAARLAAATNQLAQKWLNAGIVVLLAGFTAYASYPHLRCIPPLPSYPDVVAASALDRPQVRGRLFVEFNWGEFAIWHFAPRLRVSIDGRRETVYSPTRLNEFFAVAEGSDEGLEVIARDKPEYIWMMANRDALRTALLEAGYRIDVKTPQSFIAVRSDLPVLTPVSDSIPNPTRCFPGP
jgi:hypothetical protein